MPAVTRTEDSKAPTSTLASKSISISKHGHQNVLDKTKTHARRHVLAMTVPQYYNNNKIVKKYQSKRKLGFLYTLLAGGQRYNTNLVNHISETQCLVLNSQINSQESHNNFGIEKKLQIGHESINKNNDLNYIKSYSSEFYMNAKNTNNVKQFCFPKISNQHENLPYFNIEKDITHFKSRSFEQNHRPIISVRKDLINPDNISKVDDENTNIKPILHERQFDIKAHLPTMGEFIFTPNVPNQEGRFTFETNSNTQTSQRNFIPLIIAPSIPLRITQNEINLKNIANMPPSSFSALKMKTVGETLKCYTCNKVVLDSAGKSLSLIYDHLFFGRASCKICSKKVSCLGFTKIKEGFSNCCKYDQLAYNNDPIYYLVGELDNCEKNPCHYIADYINKLKLLWIYEPWNQAIVQCNKFIKSPYAIPSYIFKGWDENNSLKQNTSVKEKKRKYPTGREPLKNKEIQNENKSNIKKECTRIKRSLTDKDDKHKQTTSFKEKKRKYETGREPLKDKEIKKLKLNQNEMKIECTSIKRSLTDKDNKHKQKENLSPPAKKQKKALRTFRIKEEPNTDICDLKVESSENCYLSDQVNEMTTNRVCVSEETNEIQHKHKNEEIKMSHVENDDNSSQAHSIHNETFSPKIIEVYSIRSMESTFDNYVNSGVENFFESKQGQISFNEKEKKNDNPNNTFHSSQYDEKNDVDISILEQSCGSTIMTPDASPIDNTKISTGAILSKKRLSSSLKPFTSVQGNICVSEYIKDVCRINSNSLVSLKTIEECPICYVKLSLTKMTVNAKNFVLKFICSCNLHIHIIPNFNGKVVWPFYDKEYKPSERVQRSKKKVPNKRKLVLSYFFK